MKKKIALLFFVLLLLGIIIYFLPTNKYEFVKDIKESVPQKYKKFLKNTLFALPELFNRVEMLEKNSKDFHERINNNYSSLNIFASQLTGINLQGINFKIIKKPIPFHKTANYGDGKPIAYMARYKDKIFFISGYGKILSANIENFTKDLNINYFEIKNNLREIITDKAFWDVSSSVIVRDKTGWDNNLSNGVSIKGLMVDDNKIYISYLREVKNKCYATSILFANLNDDFLNFEKFYVPENCVSPLDTEFLAHAAGGRMAPYKDNKILLTVGDFSHFNIAQDDKLHFGKIISIDKNKKNIEIISKGHRNPQGLIYLKDEDVILSTEHGPRGGDEINKIVKNGNYGWPIASYGIIYGHEIKKIGPKFESHKTNGFMEPIFHWKINPGIGQIIKIPDSFSNKLSNSFFLTSLSGSLDKNGEYQGKSLFLVKFDKEFSKVMSIERLFLGERIRDIIYLDSIKAFLISLENTSSIGLVSEK